MGDFPANHVWLPEVTPKSAGESSFSPYETRGAAGGEVTLTPRHVAGDGPGDLVERSNDDLSGHVTMWAVVKLLLVDDYMGLYVFIL